MPTEHLADSLYDTAMYLAFHNHWIYHVSFIIYGNKTFQFHFTRLLIYFYYSDMATEWIGKICRVIKTAEIKTRFQVFRIYMRDISR